MGEIIAALINLQGIKRSSKMVITITGDIGDLDHDQITQKISDLDQNQIKIIRRLPHLNA